MMEVMSLPFLIPILTCHIHGISMVSEKGSPTGTMGFAYLESPGVPYDDIDNDKDGLLNEKRDNVAVNKVGPTDGIHNLQDFQYFID